MASRLHLIPRPLLQLIATILLTPSPLVQAGPQPVVSQLAGFSFNDLFARWDCGGTYCGYSSQLCCTAGSTCYTDSNDQAQCGAGGGGATAVATAAGGYWSTYYITYTETDTVLTTQMMSTYIAPAATAAATTAGTCNYALNETPCGNTCCASNQYCYAAGTCSAAANGGSSGYYSTYTTPGATAGATGAAGSPPIRGTSSSLVLVTQTASPSTTVPFQTPVATGANVTLTNTGTSHSGLSGGAIAGIVIGVLVGLLLLALIIFYCCLRGLWNTFFGGRRRRRTTEVEEYERRTHHSSGGGGRTWYGAARPARVSRYEERDRRGNRGKEILGVGAGLATLWAVLGLKRKRDEKRRKEDEVSEYYSSDYYTSASSASSDDRRTRDTRRSVSRR